MISVSIEKLAEVQEALKATPERVNLVLSRAVNRSVTNAKANIAKKVTAKYAVKSSDVKLTISDDKKATAANPTAIIKSVGKKIDYVDFSLTPKNLFKGQHDYSIKITKSGGWEKVPGFAAASNKWGLFKRKGPDRYPWSRLMGPAIPQMIGSKDVIEQIERDALAMLNKRVDAELNYELNVRGKK